MKEINFDKVIVTPLDRWVDTCLELSSDVLAYLNMLAEKSNQSMDNVINHILTDMLSEPLELTELCPEKLLELGARTGHILLLDKGKALARVEFIKPSALDLVEEISEFPTPALEREVELTTSYDQSVKELKTVV